ncbi:methyltransferase domain-containing protein [Streptomyces scopuliridis]|uniref:Methyltransferase domain-containing protein n=1 Tax=Streptomyces scopuliridis TaxID=452529 RepID=A0ACD4ZE44_9ACTN|nr:methyltransferase domain-containing protein [Streptomyces scopuliridis]WSB96729.1 methyltransferase domain-containing protein [Streptomyces scopuliridis]WSC09568.1 methyltransferase domain-containing protein [Streptomyces scopuliridis]
MALPPPRTPPVRTSRSGGSPSGTSHTGIPPAAGARVRRTPARWLADRGLFIAETLRTTGAVTPSGRPLAQALAAPLADRTGRPRAVLEVGAGTGAVSRVLAGLLGPEDTLDLVESNPRFARVLAADLRADPRLAVLGERVGLIAAPVQELDPAARYDVIVSGLPFTNFDPDEVADLLARYLTALRPGGRLTYFGYRGTTRLRAVFGSSRSLARHSGVVHVLDSFQRAHAVGCRTVWSNVPPARVWQLSAPGTTADR